MTFFTVLEAKGAAMYCAPNEHMLAALFVWCAPRQPWVPLWPSPHAGAATFGVELLCAVVAVWISNVPPLNASLLTCRAARRVFLKSFAAPRPDTIGR